jgi:hypothetical protein
MQLTFKKSRPLRAGDWVQVRSLDAILATLDDAGALDAVPFMPEMAAYCGLKFEVWKRADKTCDEGRGGAIRRLTGAVHLKEARCDGSAHGGCDAGCLFFWKEQWLERIDPFEETQPAGAISSPRAPTRCSRETLIRATRRGAVEQNGDQTFSCQATQVHSFTTPLAWWDLRQYVRDVLTRNVSFVEFFRGLYIGAFNKIQHMRRSSAFHSSVRGSNKRTPQASLDLAPGDLVQINSSQAITQTLDPHGKNTGLSFRPVMLPYCGKQYRVLRRVNQIINPGTGKMLRLGGNCVILDGVVCTGDVRRFCPRMVYTYWRDIWLTKVSSAAETSSAERVDDQLAVLAFPASCSALNEDPRAEQT